MKSLTIFLSLFLILITCNIKAQLVVTNTATPEDLVQDYLVGAGVTVSNVTFNGMPGTTIDEQIGFFDGVNTNLGIDSGLVMSTGMVVSAAGPEVSFASTSYFATSGDPDLNAISVLSVNDNAILEFDIVPTGDTLQFKFSFASEEYPNFVGAGLNDAFGIFLSGTGIAGPFSNGAENIALVPGTAIPISIDNVNVGVNSAFYIDNSGNPDIAYGGRTVTMIASYPVQCGGTYHLKFAIGDGGDSSYDSGVFIEAGSLTSTGVQVSLETPVGFFSNVPGIVYEDCAIGSDVDFIFVRPDSAAGDTVFFDIGGNAINGSDYTNIPNNYVVFNNSDTAILTISAIGDGLVEGVDTLWIAVPISNSGPCAMIYDTSYLYISDPYEVIPNAGPDSIYYCAGQIIDFIGNVDVGVPPYNYSWSDGTNNTNVNYTITQLGNDTLILDIVDACGFIGSDTVFLLQQAPPPIFVDAGPDSTLTCAGQSVQLGGAATGGVPTLSLTWNVADPSLIVQPLFTTSYILTAVDDCLNEVSDTMTVFVPTFVPFDINRSDSTTTLQCLGNATSLFGYPLSGGNAPYSYLWSTGSTDSLINVTLLSNNVNFMLTIEDNCGLDTTLNFNITSNQTPIDFNLSSDRQCRNADSTASLIYSLSGGATPYSIVGGNFPSGVFGYTVDSISSTILIEDAQSGVYTFEVTDQCGTFVSDSTELILRTCSVSTPNVITPNGDGFNDFLVFDGLAYHPNSELYVYNRWGNLVYSNPDYQNDWNGGGLNGGLYYYVLMLTDGSTPNQYAGHINIFY